MRINFRTILLALPLAFASCSDFSDADPRPATGTISVSVGSGPKIDIESEDKTRTELGEDGVSVKWSSDDQIALWAVNSRSETTLDKQVFKLYHYNAAYNTARFTGNIAPMPEDTYTYYAVSPAPAESNGTEATYLIPAVQNGAFNGDWDVMVAEPVTAPALEKDDTGNLVQFQFRHKVHVLKIRIPKNDLGEKVSEITLAFPQPVTGRMTVDAAKPDAAPTLTSGSSTLTLRFDEPKDAGDVVFAVIAPTELSADQAVTVTAICEVGESEPRDIAGKNFAAGHTTPIAYNIPAIGLLYTRLTFSLPADKGTATLGEEVKKITLTAPEGSLFDNGSNVREFTPDADGSYTMVLKPSWTDNLSGKTVTVQYESESAIVSGTLQIGTIKPEEANETPAFAVPYLLAEDFSQVKGFSNHDNAATGGTAIDTYTDAIWLDQYNLAGWSGTRCGAEAGNAFRICVRTENAWVANPRYHGRLDTCPLGIKEGKTAKVKVSFDYSISISWTKHTPQLAYGYHTTDGLINSTSSSSTALNNPVKDKVTGSGGSYSNISSHASYTIDQCSNLHRLAWDIYSTGTGFSTIGNSNGYCYLDNIKVSIVNE